MCPALGMEPEKLQGVTLGYAMSQATRALEVSTTRALHHRIRKAEAQTGSGEQVAGQGEGGPG